MKKLLCLAVCAVTLASFIGCKSNPKITAGEAAKISHD
jgi:hypothetical protein